MKMPEDSPLEELRDRIADTLDELGKKEGNRMGLTETPEIGYLKTLPLVDALWWFIENISDGPEGHPERTEIFFYLRERYRASATALAVEDGITGD